MEGNFYHAANHDAMDGSEGDIHQLSSNSVANALDKTGPVQGHSQLLASAPFMD